MLSARPERRERERERERERGGGGREGEREGEEGGRERESERENLVLGIEEGEKEGADDLLLLFSIFSFQKEDLARGRKLEVALR